MQWVIIAEYIWFLVVMDKSCFHKNKDVVVTESGVRTHAVNDYQKSHQFFGEAYSHLSLAP